MSGDRPPFGFGPGSNDPDEPGGFNPFGGAGGFDMESLGAALQQIGALLQGGGLPGGGETGPVDWNLAKDTARKVVAAQGDPSITESERATVAAALALAETWLDGATVFPSSGVTGLAWSASEWVENTMPAWQRYIEPVAAGLAGAMQSFMPDPTQAAGAFGMPEGVPPELAAQLQAMAGPLMGMAQRLGATMYGTQVGQGIGALASQVVSGGDVGIPLTAPGGGVLLPKAVAEFGDGLGIPADEVRLYLALREAAHQRLFTAVPWLRPRMEGAMEAYAAGVHVDRDRIESAIRELDPQDPAALQDVLSSGVFEPEDTPEQRAALARLETLLALVEGWVDAVVDAAATGRLPNSAALRETLRRRRAIGGPAEKTFATLVGLEMRPRRLRDAASLFESLTATGGIDTRDAVWGHPDLLPTSDDLDDVEAFVRRSAPLDIGVIEAQLGEDLDGDGSVGPTEQ